MEAVAKEIRFIEKAKSVHGEKYDYSNVSYKNSTTSVCIVCPEHGEFWQIPNYHLSGAGCPVCKKTKEFIEKARNIHGDKYWYGNVVYRTAGEKVEIGCPKHGPFMQSTYTHIVGCGCPKCGKELSAQKNHLTTEEFIERAHILHGDKYDYSNTKYIDWYTKVCITCKKHGDFWQMPDCHIRHGNGCPECGKEKSGRLTTVTFIEKAINVHGDKYDYSKVNYRGWNHPVDIICKKHGVFSQKAFNHLQGRGCPECGKEKLGSKKMLTTEWFTNKARAVHGDKYDYSKTKYVGYNSKVAIICPEHGEFSVSPTLHLKGRGCPDCIKKANIEKTIKRHYEVAKNYLNAMDYRNDHPYYYYFDLKNGLIDTYTWMDKASIVDGWGREDNTTRVRCIYAEEFEETKTVYVGLTKNKKRRHLEHTKPKYKSHTGERVHNPVYDYMEKTGLVPRTKYYEDKLTKSEAQFYEGVRSSWYVDNGWTLLNVAPTGSLGGHKAVKELTIDEIIKEAHKYKTPSELQKENPYVLRKIWEYGISKECFPNIIHRKKCENRKRITQVRRYTSEVLKELCGKYASFQEIRSKDEALYMYLRNHGLVYDYFPNYQPGKSSKRVIKNVDRITKRLSYDGLLKKDFFNLVSKYNNRSELRNSNRCLYNWVRKNNNEWLDECFPIKVVPYKNRTKGEFAKVCLKCKNKSQLRDKNEDMYLFLRENRKEWLEEFFPVKK